jgi:hypothetical protein
LTQKDKPFIFGPEQIEAQEDLKATLLKSPAPLAIDYSVTTRLVVVWIERGARLINVFV